MTAPWAALALLWGSLCAGEDWARRGGRGRARRAGLGRRAVFTNKGRARGLLAAPPAPSLPLGARGRGLGARWAPCLPILGGRSCSFGGLATACSGLGSRTSGLGFRLLGRVEPREIERKTKAWRRWPDLKPGGEIVGAGGAGDRTARPSEPLGVAERRGLPSHS